MATTCAVCTVLVYGGRTYHSACERVAFPSTRLAPIPAPRPHKAPSTRPRPPVGLPTTNPPARARVVAPKPPRGKAGLHGTLRAMGCVQCPTCKHFMAPEHPATCTGDVLMLGYGDLEGFTEKLTSAQQIDNEARRLAHAIADHKGEVAA